ncbi:DUF4190 domain-containing protein [Actinomadura sp. 6N118]|uniref:DUF4190 domain-containing protein n=1 Tax=Actinomadura sp. 6N118 TaxID=3375151 RepID=UPI0037AFD8BB
MSQPPHDPAPGEQPDDKPEQDKPPSSNKPGDQGEQPPQLPVYGRTAPQPLPPFGEQPPPSYQEQRDYGQVPSYGQAPAPGRTNALAIGSLIAGIVGILAGCVLIVPIAAIVLGHLALSQIKKTGEAGLGLAITGLVLGYVGLLGWIAYWLLFVIGAASEDVAMLTGSISG